MSVFRGKGWYVTIRIEGETARYEAKTNELIWACRRDEDHGGKPAWQAWLEQYDKQSVEWLRKCCGGYADTPYYVGTIHEGQPENELGEVSL